MRAKHRARYRDQVETEIDNLNRLDEAGLDVSSVVTGQPDDLERMIADTRAELAVYRTDSK